LLIGVMDRIYMIHKIKKLSKINPVNHVNPVYIAVEKPSTSP